MSRAGRIEGRRTSKRRSRGNESEREEQKLPQTKTKQKDDRKCAACLAPNTEDRLEAVIERETQQRLNCLISPKRRQPKCEVPPPPFRPPPNKTLSQPFCSATARADRHAHIYTQFKSPEVEPSVQSDTVEMRKDPFQCHTSS